MRPISWRALGLSDNEMYIHVLLLLTAISFPIQFLDGKRFGYHPSCMSLGYLACMGEGVFAGIKLRSIPPGQARVTAIIRHALLQLVGIAFIASGFYAIYSNKTIAGKAHFTSRHGKCGLAALLLTAGAPLLGAVSFKSLHLLALFPERLQAPIKAAHRRMGAFVWLLALLAIELTLTHHVVRDQVSTVSHKLPNSITLSAALKPQLPPPAAPPAAPPLPAAAAAAAALPADTRL